MRHISTHSSPIFHFPCKKSTKKLKTFLLNLAFRSLQPLINTTKLKPSIENLTAIVVVEVKNDCFITIDDKVVASAEGWINRLWLHMSGGSVDKEAGAKGVGVRGSHGGGNTCIIHDVNLVWTSS